MQVFSGLLLEELRAHLQQSADENPAAASICSTSSSGGGGSWSELAGTLSASSAAPLRLLEAQRQSDLHLLRFEPAAAGASGAAAAAAAAAAAGGQPLYQPPESAAEFSRSSGIRTDDLLLLVSRPTAAGAVGAAPGLPPAAVALAAVESLHQQHQSERRQQQGLQGRHKQLLLTARVSLKGSGGSAARQLLQQQLTPGTSWHAVRLMSLTPHLRQLQALVAAQRLPPLLLAELLSPGTTTAGSGSGSGGAHQQQPLAAVHPPLAAPMLRQLQQHYNSSQQAAIAAAAAGYQPARSAAAAGAAQGAVQAAPAASSRGQRHVTLVQGPPGTGKTSAILGMLSVFLSANAPRGSGSGSGKAGSAGKAPASSKQPPPAAHVAAGRPAAVINPTVRVLLCAQSNAAVDELCTRLASRGVVGR